MADPTTINIPRVWRSEIPRLSLFLILSIASIVLSAHFPQSIIHGELITLGSTTISLSLPLFWLMPAFVLMLALVNIYNVRYEVDGRGIEARVGILGLNQTVTRVCYEDIRSIETDQNLLERFLDIGSVDIGTAATGNIEISMDGIGSPIEIQNLIQAERDRRQRPVSDDEPIKETRAG